jgi:hypothetical protein
LAGSLCTSAGLMILNGLLSPIPTRVAATVAVCGLVLLAARSLGLLCLDLPQRRHQIPRDVFVGSPARAAFRFAFELGTGVRTFITATAPYAAALLAVLCLPRDLPGATLAAVALSMGYGLGRSAVVGMQAFRRSIAVEHPGLWLRAADVIAVFVALGVAIRFFVEA